MDAFPKEFCYQEVSKIEPATDVDAMRKVREHAVEEVKKTLAKGDRYATVVTKSLSFPDQKRLARELCERFPGRVSYWVGREDSYLIKDGANPPAAPEYIIYLGEKSTSSW